MKFKLFLIFFFFLLTHFPSFLIAENSQKQESSLIIATSGDSAIADLNKPLAKRNIGDLFPQTTLFDIHYNLFSKQKILAKSEYLVFYFYSIDSKSAHNNIVRLGKEKDNYDPQRVSFYLVNVDQKGKNKKNLIFRIKKRNYPFVTLLDHRLRLHNKLFAQPIRESLLIVHRGVIHYLQIGYDPQIAQTLTQTLNEINKESKQR